MAAPLNRIADPPRAADVVVVGGGIVGAASAFWLARAGHRPVLVERAAALASATTAASVHGVRAQWTDPENVAMIRESLDLFARFPEVLYLPPAEADIGLTRQGYLFASTDPGQRDALRERVERQHELGLADVALLDGEAVRRRFPWLTREVTAATFRAGDGWLDGRRAATLFARASGAPILLGTEVLEIERVGDRVVGVATSRGRVATDTVVLATGPFTAGPTGLAGEPLPLTLLRRHRLILAPHPGIPQDAPMTIDADTGAHWRPHGGGAVLAWPLPEPAMPPAFPVPPDPSFPALVLHDPRGVSRLAPFWRDVAATIPAVDLDLVAGQYTMTPDHKPLIGPAAHTVGLWLHTGYSGHGVMGSPSGGRLLADLITGRVPDAANPFRLGRFAEGVGLEVERGVL